MRKLLSMLKVQARMIVRLVRIVRIRRNRNLQRRRNLTILLRILVLLNQLQRNRRRRRSLSSKLLRHLGTIRVIASRNLKVLKYKNQIVNAQPSPRRRGMIRATARGLKVLNQINLFPISRLTFVAHRTKSTNFSRTSIQSVMRQADSKLLTGWIDCMMLRLILVI